MFNHIEVDPEDIDTHRLDAAVMSLQGAMRSELEHGLLAAVRRRLRHD